MTGSLGSKEPGRSEAGRTFCLAGIESERWKMLKNAVRLQGDSGCHVEFRLYPEGRGAIGSTWRGKTAVIFMSHKDHGGGDVSCE